SGSGGDQLDVAFTDFRRDEWQPERSVDVLFARAHGRRPIGRLIAVDRQPASALARDRAKRVQMSERTGQMEERRPQPVGVRKSESAAAILYSPAGSSPGTARTASLSTAAARSAAAVAPSSA